MDTGSVHGDHERVGFEDGKRSSVPSKQTLIIFRDILKVRKLISRSVCADYQGQKFFPPFIFIFFLIPPSDCL